MTHISRIAFGTLAVLCLSPAVAEEDSSVVALADGHHIIRPYRSAADVLDRYAGRYETPTGVAFAVIHEAGTLTIDVPASFGLLTLRLHPEDESGSFRTDAGRVVFRTDAAGRVTGFAFHNAGAVEAIVARKAPMPRGIVTIHDLPTAAAAVAQSD
ncbi:MAG TPA: hypothetical protein VF329_11470 [Gammaproteobacteria bacterium]